MTKLAHDHPAMSDLTEALALRSMAAHPLARFALNKRVTKCRAKVRTSVNIAQAEFVLNNPIMPRRRLVVQHRIRALKGTEEGAQDIFDAEQKGRLLTYFYENLFEATEVQEELPTWVDLNKQFHFHELAGLPTIDGSLLRKGN